MFIDELEIFVQSGKGGNGCTSFRREKYIEFGGPNGGDGGHGGSIRIQVRPDFNTLMPLRNMVHYRADNGRNGQGSDMTGACGQDLVLGVPPGTIVRDRETGTILGDLTNEGDEIIVAHGGRGGKGNAHFASSTNRAPRFSQPGEPGESLWLKVELKIMADVGLVGFPNAGKSTLISAISAAKPKIAGYPFTTLEPSLGVVKVGDFQSFVVADIPGIIEGAHEGAGLGLRFLRHIERTALLLILIDPADPERDVNEAFRILTGELEAFSVRLLQKPRAVVFTKADIPLEDTGTLRQLQNELSEAGIPWFEISAVARTGLNQLKFDLFDMIVAERKARPVDNTDEEEETEAPKVEEHRIGGRDPLDEI